MYHINPKNGNPGVCNPVKTGVCKYGSAAEHFVTAGEAAAAFEARHAGQTFPSSISSPSGVLLSRTIDPEILQRDIELGYIVARPHELDPDLKILCYTKNTQFDGHWTAATIAARGLIIRSEKDDLSDAEVVERPWKKFFTLQQLGAGWSLGDEEAEGSADELMASIDFSAPAEVTDKTDGSMGVLYLAPDGKPAISTKGSFHSIQAQYYTDKLRANSKMVSEMKELLTTSRTHVFELVGPDNQIVLRYNDDDYILLGAIERESGIYRSAKDVDGWSGTRVESFEAKNLEDALALPERPNKEGLVVRLISEDPEKQMQIKFKQEDYKVLHRIITNFSVSDLRAAIRDSEATMGDLLRAHDKQDISDLNSIRETFIVSETNPALGPIMDKRKEMVSGIMLPRVAKLAEARDYVDSVADEFLANDNPPKAFAESVKGLPAQKKADVFMFFNTKMRGESVEDMRVGGIFRNIAGEIKSDLIKAME